MCCSNACKPFFREKRLSPCNPSMQILLFRPFPIVLYSLVYTLSVFQGDRFAQEGGLAHGQPDLILSQLGMWRLSNQAAAQPGHRWERPPICEHICLCVHDTLHLQQSRSHTPSIVTHLRSSTKCKTAKFIVRITLSLFYEQGDFRVVVSKQSLVYSVRSQYNRSIIT